MLKKLIFASNNPDKLREVRTIVPAEIELLSPAEIGFIAEIEETGKTFEENALIKANAIFAFCGLPCFADDSGLETEALGGLPGVKSARYSGEPVNHQRNIKLLLKNLEGKKNRHARFVTVICLRNPIKTLFFEGFVNGHITDSPRGKNGFGYDPVFEPEGCKLTFAEMDIVAKNAISHRQMAIKKFLDFLPYV